MRLSAADHLGETGQKYVEFFFTQLGWGPLPTGRQDLGTDLFVQVRSGDRDDLGMLMGVQVKSGDSWFSEPGQVGASKGWWFRESSRGHQTYWGDHHIPHILVLVDKHQERTAWVYLSKDALESTGAGFKIFVPEDQKLTSSFADEWISLVETANRKETYEGARWDFDLSDIEESGWARYALLASRIVAPHPNRGFAEDIGWAQAAALCLQGSPERWDWFAEQRKDVPTVSEARLSPDAHWRFAAAIYGWVIGNEKEMEGLSGSFLPPDLRIPQAICSAVIKKNRGDIDQALDELCSLRDPKRSSVDQAWLAVHIGLNLHESGRIEEAREVLADSVAMHASFSSSLINSAVRSAGIVALYEAAERGSEDVGAAARALDNTLSWWQTQQLENGLNDYLRRSFNRWANDKSVEFGGSDVANNELVSVSITAQLIGNQRSSRYAAYLLSMASLSLPKGEHADPADQLDSLRKAGYKRELVLALTNLRHAGPLIHVADFMSRVTPERVSTSSFYTDLKALETAGSYMESSKAREWIDQLLATLTGEPAESIFALRWRDSALEVLEALRGLILHFAPRDKKMIVDYIFSLPEDSSPILEGTLAKILNQIPMNEITNRGDEYLRRAKEGNASWLGVLRRNYVVSIDAEVRQAVSAEIQRGELGSIPDGFRVDLLTEAEIDSITSACESAFRSFAGSDGATVTGTDPYLLMAKLAFYGRASSRPRSWRVLLTGISAEDVLHSRKTSALQLLADRSDAVPSEHYGLLRHICAQFEGVAPGPFTTFFSSNGGDPGVAFKQLGLELEDDDAKWTRGIARLLAGGAEERESAAALIGRRPGRELALLALVRDANSAVAHAAMYGLARRATSDAVIAQMAVPELLSIISTSGEQAALNIGGGILRSTNRVDAISPLIRALIAHESLQIRKLAFEFDGIDHK